MSVFLRGRIGILEQMYYKCLWQLIPTVNQTFYKLNTSEHYVSSYNMTEISIEQAVTYMTEISLIVTLNNQFNSTSIVWAADRVKNTFRQNKRLYS